MSYKQRAITGAAIVFFMSLLAAGLGYVLRLYLARALTPAEYGLFYAVVSFIALFIVAKDLGLGTALATSIPRFQTKNQFEVIKAAILSVFSTQFFFAGSIALLLILLSGWLADAFFHNISARIIIIFIAVSYWLSTFYDVFLVSAQGFQRMFFASLTEFLRSLSVLVCVFVLFFFFDGVLVPALAFFVVMLFLPFVYFFLFLKFFPSFFQIKAAFSKKMYKELFSIGFPILLGSLGGTIIAYTDTLSLTYFRSLEEVALYQAALPTSMLLWSVSQALAFVLLPLTSELWSKGHVQELREGMASVHTYSFAAILPLGLSMLFFAPLILSLLFPSHYSAAAIALQILGCAAIFFTIYCINGSFLVGIGKPKLQLTITLFGAAVNLVGNILFVPAYGIVAAAFSTFVSYFFMMLLGIFFIRKHAGSFVSLRTWSFILLCGGFFILALFFLTRILSLSPIIETIISLLIATVLYILLLSSLHVIRVKEVFSLLKLH